MLSLGIPDERGILNEARLYRIVESLVARLVTKLPEVVCGRCRKSEHFDVHDRNGEDVSVSLTVRNGDRKVHGRVVYDAKSSARGVRKYYNLKKDRRSPGPGQKDCLMRKAILISEDRSDGEIEDEIFDDLISVGLLTAPAAECCRLKAVA